MSKKPLVLTGGGSAGHVTPHLALIPHLKNNYELHYIGTAFGIERTIIESTNIVYHSISAGKLRRYFSWQNLADVLRVVWGCLQSTFLLGKLKPALVFAKGGFVSVPVVIGAWFNRIPVITHESDYTPGLANKLIAPFAKKICYTFPETKNDLPKGKSVWTGTPIRAELFNGNAIYGKTLCGFQDEKPVLLVIGGSLGAKIINDAVRALLHDLLDKFNVCHICGKNNIDLTLNNLKGYCQFEYIAPELPHVFALSDIVLSRAGANVIFELLALKKPSILIPLSKKASRGDQLLNAQFFVKQGFSIKIEETELSPQTLNEAISEIFQHQTKYIDAMKKSQFQNGVETILKLIESTVHQTNTVSETNRKELN